MPQAYWIFLWNVGHIVLSPFFSLFFFSQYPELLVASYNNNEDAPHEPDGVALIWNMKYQKESPEYIFHCQVSRITSSDPLPFSSQWARASGFCYWASEFFS